MKSIVFVIPLISAFIGYITNYIAIIMLFRPYNEIKILGIKIFGKGVIPRNHKKLAVSIGRTVSEELLSSEDILRKLNSEKINSLLKETISQKLVELTTKDYKSLEDILPHELHYLKVDLKKKGSEFILEHFLNFLQENKDKNAALISSLIENLSSNSFEKILTKREITSLENKLKSVIEDKIDAFLSAENMIPKILKFLHNLSESEKNVGELIPEKLDTEIRKNIPVITTEVVKQLKILLNKEDTKEEIKARLSEFTSSLLENANLGMLSMFLTTDFIQDKINLLVNKGVPYLEENLESEEYREKISKFIISIYEDYSNKKIVDLFEGYLSIDESHSLENLSDILFEGLFNYDNRFRIKSGVLKYLDENFGDLLKSIADYLTSKSDNLGEVINSKIVEYCESNPKVLKEYSEKIVDFILKLPLPKLSLLLTSNDIEALSHYVLKIIRNQMEIYLPQIFATLDINGIVTEKVLGFPLPKLEKIIRNVAEKELKYITIFGAILGFLIGLIQIIFIYM